MDVKERLIDDLRAFISFFFTLKEVEEEPEVYYYCKTPVLENYKEEFANELSLYKEEVAHFILEGELDGNWSFLVSKLSEAEEALLSGDMITLFACTYEVWFFLEQMRQ